VRPVQTRFSFPCFWQHYLNFDTSSSFLRRILGLISVPSLTTDKNTPDEGDYLKNISYTFLDIPYQMGNY
jgi:hypothetical protein